MNRVKSLNNPYPNNIYTIQLITLEFYAQQGKKELSRLKGKSDNRVKKKNEQYLLSRIETVDETWDDLMESRI